MSLLALGPLRRRHVTKTDYGFVKAPTSCINDNQFALEGTGDVLMPDDYRLIDILTIAQSMAKEQGDVVLSYLISMAILHAQVRANEELLHDIACVA